MPFVVLEPMPLVVTDQATLHDLQAIIDGMAPIREPAIDVATFEPDVHPSGAALCRRSPAS